MPRLTECVCEAGTITINEALRLRDRAALAKQKSPVFTCKGCGKRIFAHKTGSTGQAAHFEHRPAQRDCILIK